jgi:hypothetical protein
MSKDMRADLRVLWAVNIRFSVKLKCVKNLSDFSNTKFHENPSTNSRIVA